MKGRLRYLGSYEGKIKTFLVPRDGGQAVREVNLLEWPLEGEEAPDGG